MTETTEKNVVPATECTTMAEVRGAIDGIDTLIVSLMAERMRYVEAAGRIKASRDSVRDEVRKAEVIAHAVTVARDRGFPPKLAYDLYNILVEGSIAHEYAVFDARRDLDAFRLNQPES